MRFVNHHQGCCGYNPTRADGSEWGHILTLESGAVVYADSAGEALAELIPGYDRIDPHDASALLGARISHAVQQAVRTQQNRLDLAVTAAAIDPFDPADQGLVVVLTAPKTSGMWLAAVDEAGTRTEAGEQADWRGVVPLVLLTTSYAPHTQVPPITGDVIWLDPSSEAGYLASLGAARIRDYWSAAVTA